MTFNLLPIKIAPNLVQVRKVEYHFNPVWSGESNYNKARKKIKR